MIEKFTWQSSTLKSLQHRGRWHFPNLSEHSQRHDHISHQNFPCWGYNLSSILTGDGISKIVIQGIFLCLVGSIESLMTAEVVESFTKEPGDGNRTVLAMGGANILSGFLGGMGGNAMNLGSNQRKTPRVVLLFGRKDPSSGMIKTHSHTSDLFHECAMLWMPFVFYTIFWKYTLECFPSYVSWRVETSWSYTPNMLGWHLGGGNILSKHRSTGSSKRLRIGLSTVNCLNGGKGRLGPCVTALGIMACVMGAYPLLNFIPVAALAGIMLVVVLHTFKWFTIPMILAAFLPKCLRNKLSLQRKVGGGWMGYQEVLWWISSSSNLYLPVTTTRFYEMQNNAFVPSSVATYWYHGRSGQEFQNRS